MFKLPIARLINKLGLDDPKKLAELINGDPNFTDLKLRNEKFCSTCHDWHGKTDCYSLDDEMLEELLLGLKGNSNITEISLEYNCLITYEGIKVLCEFLKDNKSVTILDLGGIFLNTKSINEIAELLKNNNTLTNLYLGGCGLNDETIQILTDALIVNTTLTHFFIHGNNLNTASGKLFYSAIEKRGVPLFMPSLFGGNMPAKDGGGLKKGD
jgi:hypothetical protein